MRDAAVSVVLYKAELEKIATAQRTLKERTDAYLETMKNFNSSGSDVANTAKEMQTAWIDLQAKLGNLTKEQEIKLRFTVDDAYAKAELKRKLDEMQDEMDARQDELEGYQKNRAKDQAEAKKKRDAAIAAEQNQIKFDEQRNQTKENIKNSEESIKGWQSRLDEMETKGYNRSDPIEYKEMEILKNRIEQERSLITSYKKYLTQSNERWASIHSATELAKKSADEAEEKAREDEREIRALEHELETVKRKNDLEKKKLQAMEAGRAEIAKLREKGALADEKKRVDEIRQKPERTPEEQKEIENYDRHAPGPIVPEVSVPKEFGEFVPTITPQPTRDTSDHGTRRVANDQINNEIDSLNRMVSNRDSATGDNRNVWDRKVTEQQQSIERLVSQLSGSTENVSAIIALVSKLADSHERDKSNVDALRERVNRLETRTNVNR